MRTFGGVAHMSIANIYVHDGRLLRVIEDSEAATLTMECELPILERGERLEPRMLVFEDVYNYRVCEGAIVGPPTLLGIKVVGEHDGRARIHLDTTAGFRELDCTGVSVVEYGQAAEHSAAANADYAGQCSLRICGWR